MIIELALKQIKEGVESENLNRLIHLLSEVSEEALLSFLTHENRAKLVLHYKPKVNSTLVSYVHQWFDNYDGAPDSGEKLIHDENEIESYFAAKGTYLTDSELSRIVESMEECDILSGPQDFLNQVARKISNIN
jgi:hypothetical protein